MFELAKGAAAVLAATGLLLHSQIGGLVRELVLHLHLNPGRHHPGVLLRALAADATLHARLMALGVLLYAGLRVVEAYGLWRNRRWGLWLGSCSAAIYVPFELREFARRPSSLGFLLLFVTVATAVYLTWRIRVRQRIENQAAVPGVQR